LFHKTNAHCKLNYKSLMTMIEYKLNNVNP
jgi:hypothetical protein